MTTKDTEIVLAGEIIDDKLTLAAVQAKNALRDGKIPKEHIKKHPGKGGKMFSYVPHDIATKTMNDAMGPLWDWEILETYFYPDKSGGALGRLTLTFPFKDGTFYKRTITEFGGFEPRGDGGMSAAVVIASACSRALLRCMFRAFGYGAEFYSNEEDDWTVEKAKSMLRQYHRERGISNEEWKKRYQEAGFNDENILDRFEEAYKLVYKISEEKKNQ